MIMFMLTWVSREPTDYFIFFHIIFCYYSSYIGISAEYFMYTAIANAVIFELVHCVYFWSLSADKT